MSDIDVNIRANDQATAKINNVKGSLMGLNKQGVAMGVAFWGMQKGLQVFESAIGGAVDMVKDGVQAFRQFEDSMAEVNTMLSETDEKYLPEMREGIEDLSVKWGKSADDMARGMYQVLSASVSAADATTFLGVAAKASVAGLTSVESAVDGLTTVINAYGMSAGAAAHISDVMFTTVKRGKLRFEDLNQAMGYIVPIASQLGVSFEEVAAAMATMTKSGINATMAATSLRAIFTQIASPSEEAKQAANEYGISLDSLHFSVVGLKGIIDEINDSLGDNNSALTQIFPNVRALSGAMSLLANDGESFKSDWDAMMNDTAGATNKAALDIVESGGFVAKAVEQSIERQKRAIGEGYNEAMNDVDTFWAKFKLGIAGIGQGLADVVTFKSWGEIVSNQSKYMNAINEIDEAKESVKQTEKELIADYRAEIEAYKEGTSVVERYAGEFAVVQAAKEHLMDTTLSDEDLKDWMDAMLWNADAAAQVEAALDANNQAIIDSKAKIQLLEAELANLADEIPKVEEQIRKLTASFAIQENISKMAITIADVGIEIKFTDIEFERLGETIRYSAQNFEALSRKIVENNRYMEELKETSYDLSMQQKQISLEMLKIQYAAMGRRGRMTRNEKEQMKKLEQEQLRLRISQMENSIQTDQFNHDIVQSDQEKYNDLLIALQYYNSELMDTHEQEIQELEDYKSELIAKERTYKSDLEIVRGELKDFWEQDYAFYKALEPKYKALNLSPSGIGTSKTYTSETSNLFTKSMSLGNRFNSFNIGKILGQGQTGIPYVPETGLYKLHAGERVLNKAETATYGTGGGVKAVKVSFEPIQIYVDVDNKDTTETLAQKIAAGVRSGLITGVETVY